MKIIVQRNDHWNLLSDLCLKTWDFEARQKGFDIIVLQFERDTRSFLNLLHDAMGDDEFVGICFPDLYFTKIDLPFSFEAINFMREHELNYIRFDGRPPATGDRIGTLNSVDYFRIQEGRYFCSTVFGVFDKSLIQTLLREGYQTAWDVERIRSMKQIDVIGACPKIRTMCYRNMLIRGKVDVFQLLFLNEVRVPLLHSFRRQLSRAAKALIGCLR